MRVQVSRTVLPHESSASLACAALELRLGNRSLEFPAMGATYADYDHARKAGRSLDAETLHYYHADYKRPFTEKKTRDNVAERIGRTQERHRPVLTIIHMVHNGSLTDASLRAFHEFQNNQELDVITTTEKDPLQGIDAFKREIKEFEDFETDQAKAPTVSVRCDPEHLGAKLHHIARRHKLVNVQWGGHSRFAAGWETLSATIRKSGMWCNVIGVPYRYDPIKVNVNGKLLHPSLIIPALQYGAHSYSVMPPSFPRNEAPGGAGGAPDRVMDFDPGTWCYVTSRMRDADAAHARSFDAVQDALRLARSSILDGSFYSELCGRVPGLRASLERVMGRSAASRDPAQTEIL